jgi:uncharacterized protein YjiS (DUF1127 family)
LKREVLFLLIPVVLSLGTTTPGLFVPAEAAPPWETRLSLYGNTYGVNENMISGELEWKNNTSNVWSKVASSERVFLYWYNQGSGVRNPIDETWTEIGTGKFYYAWHYELAPGWYGIEARFQPASATTYLFCNKTAQLYVRLMLSVTVDPQTMNVAQDESAIATITVTADNSKTPNSVSLSAPNWPSNLKGTYSFTLTQGTTSLGNPFTSKFKITVSNQTQPGTYIVAVQATCVDPASTARAELTIYVQQNTYSITIIIKGLPSTVQTRVFADKTQIAQVRGEQTFSLMVSNKTATISVLKEPPSNDVLTQYICEDYVKNAIELGERVTTFTFQYQTKYAVKITANAASDMALTLKLQVGESDSTVSFNPLQGYTTKFYPEGTKIRFAITPDYIPTTKDVNYKFREWKTDKGQSIEAGSDGFYEITLNNPYVLRAYFDRYVAVKVKADPDEVPSLKVQLGLRGKDRKVVDVSGPIPLLVGEFPVDSVLEIVLDQNQYILLNSKGDTKYVFQEFNPSNQISLTKHITILIKYAVHYRVLARSQFPQAVILPAGGEMWYVKGSMATIQVSREAWDIEIFMGKRLLRYVFDRWKGAIESNQTKLSFPVVQPIETEAVWNLDLTYLMILGAISSGVAVFSAIVIKKKVVPALRERRREKRLAKKVMPLKRAVDGSTDGKILDYISRNGGSLKWSEAVRDLGMTREEITESIRRLREARLLGTSPRPDPTNVDGKILDYISRNGGSLKWSEAVRDLGMTREEITESIRRLREAKILG